MAANHIPHCLQPPNVTPPATLQPPSTMASSTATTEFAGQRVKSVARHPDWPTQKLLVVTTHKGEVVVHDLEAGASAVSRQLLAVADAHCAVRAVVWTPLGIIAGSDDGCVRLLDAATLKTLASAASSDAAPAHADYVRSISTSPDGSLVATSADDKVVRVWHLAVGDDGTASFSLLATSDAQRTCSPPLACLYSAHRFCPLFNCSALHDGSCVRSRCLASFLEPCCCVSGRYDPVVGWWHRL